MRRSFGRQPHRNVRFVAIAPCVVAFLFLACSLAGCARSHKRAPGDEPEEGSGFLSFIGLSRETVADRPVEEQYRRSYVIWRLDYQALLGSIPGRRSQIQTNFQRLHDDLVMLQYCLAGDDARRMGEIVKELESLQPVILRARRAEPVRARLRFLEEARDEFSPGNVELKSGQSENPPQP